METVPLLALHSWEVDDTLAYLGAIERAFASNSLHPRRLHAVRYHPARPNADAIAPMLDDAGRLQTLDELTIPLKIAMVLGDTADHRSNWLRARAVTSARDARAALQQSQRLPGSTCLPVFLQVDDVIAAIRDERAADVYLTAAGILRSALDREQNAQRFRSALVFAAQRRWAFSERVARILWRKLWHDPERPEEAPALVIIDNWDDLVAEQQPALKEQLEAFLDQTSAKVFIGARFFCLDTSPAYLDVFNGPGEPNHILCLWPYEIRVRSPLFSIPATRRISDIGQLREKFSTARKSAGRPLPLRRALAVGVVAAIALGAGTMAWISRVPEVCHKTDVEVVAPGDTRAVWVVIHPAVNDSRYWAQPKAVYAAGVWTSNATFGEAGAQWDGVKYLVRAIADPTRPVNVGLVPGWPPARHASAIVTVGRAADCHGSLRISKWDPDAPR